MAKKFEKEKNIIIMIIYIYYSMKDNIKMGKKMEKGSNIIKMVILKFNGEFLNGIKWDGKIYNHKQEIINELKEGYSQKMNFENEITSFEVEYVSGKIKGKGKFYSDKDNLEFLNDFGDLDLEEYEKKIFKFPT